MTNRTNYKHERYRAELTLMKNMLIRGQIDSSGCKRPFRNVEELQAYDKQRRGEGGVPLDPLTRAEQDAPSFEELRKQMQGNSKKPTSCRTLWLQMKTLFKLKKTRQRLKRQRDAKMVQVCASVRRRSASAQQLTIGTRGHFCACARSQRGRHRRTTARRPTWLAAALGLQCVM